MSQDNEIRVVITGVASDLRRALDGAKGDLGGLKAAIKDVPNKLRIDVQADTAAAVERLRQLQIRAGQVPDKITITADADTGVADAKLRLLAQRARQTEEAIARAELGWNKASSGGGFLSRFGSGLGGIPFGPIGLGVAGAPLVAAGAGSAGALIGSAGAGILGAGALGAGALGIGAVGLGSMLGVFTQAKAGIQSVSTALDALVKAQDKYGASSKQAATAQKDLNAAMSAAGPQASAIAQQLQTIQNQWVKLSGPAVKALDQIIIPGLQVVKDLMPTVAGIAKQAFDAIGNALQPVFQWLQSDQFKRALTQLGDAFNAMAGPLVGAFMNLAQAFLHVAVQSAPYLVQIAQAFERWTISFSQSLQPGVQLRDLIKGLVGQLHSWWDLAVQLGKLMINVFSQGAGTGKQMVDQLTQIVKKWNEWLNTKQGQADLHSFFSQSANLLGQVLSSLAPIAKLLASMSIGLIPTMTTLLKPIANILAAISNFVNGLSKGLPPVISALPGLAVAVGVLASWQALKAVVASTVAMMTGGGAAAGAAAAGGGALAASGAARAAATSSAASSVEAAVGGGAGAAGAASIGVLPIAAVGAGAFFGLSALSKAINGDGGVNDSLRKLQAAMRDAFASNNITQMEKLGAMAKDFGQKLSDAGESGADAFTKIGQAADQLAAKMTTDIGQLTKQQLAKVGPMFQDMQNQAGKSLDAIEQSAHLWAGVIPTVLGDGSQAAATALSKNFLIAVQDIQTSMANGVVSTSKGIAEINKLLVQALRAVGSNVKLSDVQAIGIADAQSLIGYDQTGAAGTSEPGAHAVGGLIQVGRPGAKGRDMIPMSVGGQNIVVGAGEQVAVFNHDQQKVMNARLADMGGLQGMFSRFSRPHYMAGGGLVGGAFPFPAGESFSWQRVDQGQDLQGPPGGPVLAIAPGVVSMASDSFSGFGPFYPVEAITGGPLKGRGVYYGHTKISRMGPVNAGDVIAYTQSKADQWTAAPAGWLELGFLPYGSMSAGNAIAPILHALASGSSVSAIGGGGGIGMPAWKNIAAPKWSGPGGAVGALGQAVLAKVAAAANKFGSSRSLAGGMVSGAGIHSGSWFQVASQLARAHGWSGAQVQDWYGVEQVEDGSLSLTATNPSSGAYGLAQFINGPSDYAKYGGSAGSLVGQLTAMANYIAQRYGNPSNALAHERAFNWYAGGGFVPMAGGGNPAANPAAMALAGALGSPALKNPAAGALAGAVPSYMKTIALMGAIPSRSLANQISFTILDNALNSAIAAGDIPGQRRALTSELGLEQGFLAADLQRLGQINAMLALPLLPPSLRRTLLGDKLAMLQELGTVRGNITSEQASLAALFPTGHPASFTPTAASGPNLSQLNSLLSTELQQSQQSFALSQAQFGVFSGFAPMLAGRLMGSFATGTSRVPQTGPYLLHKDEMVIPDPSGPFSNRAAATVHTSQRPIEIQLNFQNNDTPLVKLIDARMNQQALRIVSDHAGQRSRLMAGVRRTS